MGKAGQFPFLFGGTFIEGRRRGSAAVPKYSFPFLFGGTFIEGAIEEYIIQTYGQDFPSFSEGLSLRGPRGRQLHPMPPFPFLFGGTFIEGFSPNLFSEFSRNFPSFSEGLSLRAVE